MPYTRIEGSGLKKPASTTFGQPALSHTFAARPASGTLLVVTGAAFVANSAVVVSDTDSGTWTLIEEAAPTGLGYEPKRVFIAYRVMGAGTGAFTVTVSHSADERQIAWEVSAYSGLTATPYVGRSSGAKFSSTATTLTATTSVAADVDGSLLVGVVALEYLGAAANISGPITATSLAANNAFTSPIPVFGSFYKSSSGLSTQSFKFDFASAPEGHALAALFRVAAAGDGEIYGTSTVALPPVAPTGLSVTPNTAASAFVLAWNANDLTATGYKIERATSLAGPWSTVTTTGAGITTYSDGPFPAGTLRHYRVSAVGVDDTSDPTGAVSASLPGTAIDVTAPTVTLAASSAGVTAAGTVTLTATATDNVGVAAVQFYDGGLPIGTVTSPPFTFPRAVTSADNGTLTFQARASDAAGNVAFSNTVSVVVNIQGPPAAVLPPDNLSLTTATSSSLTFSWTNHATNATGIQVWRRLGGLVEYTLIQTLGPTETTFTDSGLVAQQSHQYILRAVNATAQSVFSQVLTASTLAAPVSNVLARLNVSTTQLSGEAFSTVQVTYTAVDAGGFPVAGVIVTPTSSGQGIAGVSPLSAVTSATGVVVFSVTLGATATQGLLTVTAADSTITLPQSSNPEVLAFIVPAVTDALVKAILESSSDPRFDTETTPYGLDFRPYLIAGETLIGTPTMECIPTGGVKADPNAAAMLAGAPQMMPAGYVLQFVRSGQPGRSYYLRATCTTSLGAVRVAEIRFRVYSTKGRRAGLVGGRVYQ